MSRRVRRWALMPGWTAMIAVLLLAALPSVVTEAVRWPVLLLGFVAAGMPHGALDHRIPAWARGQTLPPAALAALLAAYVTLTLAVIGLWLLAPRAGLALLLASAAVHWGLGEAWPLRVLLGRRGPPTASVVARGLLMVALPALAHPGAFADACTQVLAGLPDSPTVAAPGTSLQVLGILVVGVTVAVAVVGALRHGRRGDQGARTDILELLLLSAAMALGDPALAVGLAFVAWHAPRQLARLTALAPTPRAVLIEAIGPTLVAFTGIGALLIALGSAGLPTAAIAGIALAVVGGLTVPHALVAGWLDLRPGCGRPT